MLCYSEPGLSKMTRQCQRASDTSPGHAPRRVGMRSSLSVFSTPCLLNYTGPSFTRNRRVRSKPTFIKETSPCNRQRPLQQSRTNGWKCREQESVWYPGPMIHTFTTQFLFLRFRYHCGKESEKIVRSKETRSLLWDVSPRNVRDSYTHYHISSTWLSE